MLSKIGCIALIASASGAFAQTDQAAQIKERHDRQDQLWAGKSGLPASDVRAIRMIAGISDTTDGARIMNLDARSLNQGKHILFVEAGNGHCMRVHVIERSAGGFAEVWSLSEIPRRGLSFGEGTNRTGQGICQQGPRSPTARATPDGRIVVEVTVLADPFQRTIPVSTYSFAWDGKAYEQGP